VSMDQAVAVTASFGPIDGNLVFVTSEIYTGDLGGLGGGDANCRRLAAAAGYPGTFVALLSDASNTGLNRLGSARGFIRVDGLPIADTAADLNGRMIYPIALDEVGYGPVGKPVWTGMDGFGMRSGNDCAVWSSTSGMGTAGFANDGPGGWMFTGPDGCDEIAGLYCFENDRTDPVPPPAAVAGKRIYLTVGGFAPGGGIAAADAFCDGEKPAGAGSVKALVATTTRAASELVSPDTLYVRPDGVPVGTGRELAAGGQQFANTLRTGPWQNGDGSYPFYAPFTFTGASSFSAPGTAADTCDDWTSTAGNGLIGLAYSSGVEWFVTQTPFPCTGMYSLYCVEQ
jgi:hypothetical protein